MEVWLPFANVEVFVTLPERVRAKVLDEGVPRSAALVEGEEVTEEVFGSEPVVWDPYTPRAWMEQLLSRVRTDSPPSGKAITVSVKGYKVKICERARGARLVGFVLPDPVFGFSGSLTALVKLVTEEGLAELFAAVEEGAGADELMDLLEALAQELGVKLVSFVRADGGQVRAFSGDLDRGWREAIRAYERVWGCEARYTRGSIIASDGGAFSGVWTVSLRGLLRLVEVLRDEWIVYLASCEGGLGVDAQEYWLMVSRGWGASPVALHAAKLKRIFGKGKKKVYLVSKIPQALTKPLGLYRSDDPNELVDQLLRGRRVTVTVIRNAVASLF